MDIQGELAAPGQGTGGQGIQLRIGVHLGDVIIEDDDIYGDGVNVASRLEGIAPPGGIVLSKQVHEHLGGNDQARCVALGPQNVKNITRPIQAYRIAPGDAAGNATSPSPGVIKFGVFELDLPGFELRCAGQPVAVEPQVFDLIAFLAKNRDRTVTKDEIFSTVWHGRIVSDGALSSQIRAARKILGDDGASQHTIRTAHGRGFRLRRDRRRSRRSHRIG